MFFGAWFYSKNCFGQPPALILRHVSSQKGKYVHTQHKVWYRVLGKVVTCKYMSPLIHVYYSRQRRWAVPCNLSCHWLFARIAASVLQVFILPLNLENLSFQEGCHRDRVSSGRGQSSTYYRCTANGLVYVFGTSIIVHVQGPRPARDRGPMLSDISSGAQPQLRILCYSDVGGNESYRRCVCSFEVL